MADIFVLSVPAFGWWIGQNRSIIDLCMFSKKGYQWWQAIIDSECHLSYLGRSAKPDVEGRPLLDDVTPITGRCRCYLLRHRLLLYELRVILMEKYLRHILCVCVRACVHWRLSTCQSAMFICERPVIGQYWPAKGQCGPMVGRGRPIIGLCWPNTLEVIKYQKPVNQISCHRLARCLRWWLFCSANPAFVFTSKQLHEINDAF